jgi:hypothetical protein
MNAALLTLALLVGQEARREGGQAAAPPQLDGTWTVVYMESDGKAITPTGANSTVSIRNNTLSFTMEGGKQQTWTFAFGPNMTWRLSGYQGLGKDKDQAGKPAQPGKAGEAGRPAAVGQDLHEGVYILSNEFLCIAMGGNHGRIQLANLPGQPGGPGTPAPGSSERPGASGSAGTSRAQGAGAAVPGHGESFVIILRKQGGGRQPGG